jgi:hypothetical protein
MAQSPPNREDRLKQALRANLQKRKMRERETSATESGTDEDKIGDISASPARAP